MTLEIKSISLKRNNKTLFSDINLKLRKSQILIIKGSNGSGKSSLLEVIVGILNATSGKVYLNGSCEKMLYNRDYLYLAHNNYLKEELTVEENLMLWSKLCKKKLSVSNLLKKLEYFDLKSFFNESVKYLSLGQKRKVALSKLLLSQSNLWVLDEPTNGLDSVSEEKFISLVSRHKKNGGMAIITTHLRLKLDANILLDLNKQKKKIKTSLILDSWGNL